MSLLQNSWRAGATALGLAALLVNVTTGLQAQIADIKYYPLPRAFSIPGNITAGPDRALWFTERYGGSIGRISTDGIITEYSIADNGWYYPVLMGITAGPDGALWFIAWHLDNRGIPSYSTVGSISTAGVIRQYLLPGSLSKAGGSITTGPDGALWFNYAYRKSIGRITVDGTIKDYAMPSEIYWNTLLPMTSGPDGALWFTPQGVPGIIGRLTTAGAIKLYPVPAQNSETEAITAGPDGALWFIEHAWPPSDRIGRITTDGLITNYIALPFASLYITAGPDEALWFVGTRATDGDGMIGRLPTAGSVTEWKLSSCAAADANGSHVIGDITVGPDHNLWFTDATCNRIGQIILGQTDTTKPISHVLALPSTELAANFTVQWSGTDPGSGVRDFTIYVSDNGAPFTPWATQTTARQWTFPGMAGHVYAFYSSARDFALNQEDPKIAAEATTQVASSVPGDVNADGRVNCTDLAVIKASIGKQSGQLGFNPRADVNADGVVDVRDLAFVSRLLPSGSTCP